MVENFMQQGAKAKLHTLEFADYLGRQFPSLSQVERQVALDSYENLLMATLPLQDRLPSPSNYTTRGTFGPDRDSRTGKDRTAWQHLLAYISTFTTGPEDELVWIILTPRGFKLYVAIHTP
jgi:hypothetical protein